MIRRGEIETSQKWIKSRVTDWHSIQEEGEPDKDKAEITKTVIIIDPGLSTQSDVAVTL